MNITFADRQTAELTLFRRFRFEEKRVFSAFK